MKKINGCKNYSYNRKFFARIFMVMKITLLFFFVAIGSVFADSTYSQNAFFSIKLNNATVQQVFDEIQKKSEFIIFYKDNQVDLNHRANIDAVDATVNQILDQSLKGTNLGYKIIDRQIVILASELKESPEVIVSLTDSEQKKGISGTVKDSQGLTMPGVAVVVKGTSIGIVTDANGKFALSIPKDAKTLVFSFIGMKSQEFAITGKTSFDVVMEEETIGIEEVVAVGYGVQKKSLVTGAISSVSSADIENTSVTQAQQAIQGKISGVQVINTSGSPGAPIKVRIRGYSSNNNSDPIYIVDGIKTNDITNLDPNDISVMEVLKDAASTAIYGAEGGNGVVMIKTKKGETGKPIINYDFQYGFQSVGFTPKMMNTTQYNTYMNEGGLLQNVDKTYNTDWLASIFETAPMQKHYISFSGGKDGSTYMLSLSYLNQDGIVAGPKDKYKRYTVRLNSDHQIMPWLKVGNAFTYSYTNRSAIDESSGDYGGVIGSALQMDPATPVKYNGAIPARVQTLIDEGKPLVKSPDGYYYGISTYQSMRNPFVTQALSNGNDQTDRLQGNLYAVLSPLKGLNITSRFSLGITYQNYHYWSPTFYYIETMQNSLTKVTDNNDHYKDWLWENFATYNKKIGNHDLTFLFGISAEKNIHRITNAQGGPMILENSAYAQLNYISDQANDQVNGRIFDNRKTSYFGRLTYNFNNKYLLEGSLRRDGGGLSQLPESGRWGYFPAISAGWVLSNEDFFPKSFITTAKLRSSWGKNGSLSNLGNYSYASMITSTSNGYALTYPMADGSFSTVFEPTQTENPNLRWETSVQTDIGLDLYAFQNRLSITIDYYNKKTTDLITMNTPALEVGNSASPINAGDVINKGLEFEFGYRNKIHDFNYGIHLNLSTLNNKVTYLDPSVNMLYGANVGSGISTVVKRDEPLWYFYGYKTRGIDQSTGDPIFVDKNGKETKTVTEADKQYIGSAIPNLIYGGNLDMSYKNFDFSMNFQGTSGNDVLLGLIRNDVPTVNRPEYFFIDRWTTTNTTGTKPRAGSGSKTWNSDQIVFSGSYMRIKQIQLGYNLPKALIHVLKMQSARFYVSLDDFFTFTNYIGMDPEAGSNNNNNNNIGIDRGTYPTSRKFIFGTSISF